MNRLPFAFLACLLAGCSSLPPIDTTYTSTSQDSRAQYLVIHFTSEDFPSALKTLPTMKKPAQR